MARVFFPSTRALVLTRFTGPGERMVNGHFPIAILLACLICAWDSNAQPLVFPGLVKFDMRTFPGRDPWRHSADCNLSKNCSAGYADINPHYFVGRGDVLSLQVCKCVPTRDNAEKCTWQGPVGLKMEWGFEFRNRFRTQVVAQKNSTILNIPVSLFGSFAEAPPGGNREVSSAFLVTALKHNEVDENVDLLTMKPRDYGFSKLAHHRPTSYSSSSGAITWKKLLCAIKGCSREGCENGACAKSQAFDDPISPLPALSTTCNGNTETTGAGKSFRLGVALIRQEESLFHPGDDVRFARSDRHLNAVQDSAGQYQSQTAPTRVSEGGYLWVPPGHLDLAGDPDRAQEEPSLGMLTGEMETASLHLKVSGDFGPPGSPHVEAHWPTSQLLEACLSGASTPRMGGEFVYPMVAMRNACARYGAIPRGLTPTVPIISRLRLTLADPPRWFLVDENGVEHRIPYRKQSLIVDAVTRAYQDRIGRPLVSTNPVSPKCRYRSQAALVVVPGPLDGRTRFEMNAKKTFWGGVIATACMDKQPKWPSLDRLLLLPGDRIFVSRERPTSAAMNR